MTTSILTSIKKMLGITEDYTPFDPELIIFINGGLAILAQLGVGPSSGVMISDKIPTWSLITEDDNRLNMVQTHTYLHVRLLFDPPRNSFTVTSMKEQKEELAWRIKEQREEDKWTEPPKKKP